MAFDKLPHLELVSHPKHVSPQPWSLHGRKSVPVGELLPER